MKISPLVVCLFLFPVFCYAQPTVINAADVFSLNMVGQTWVFQNSLGDTTRIDVQPSPYAGCVVLFITKSTSRAYWSPGSGGAQVQFEICQAKDGGWYSSRSIMSGSTDAGGHHNAWKSTSNVTLVPSMPQTYQIIPPSGSSQGTTSLVGKFRNYNLNQSLTFADITQNPNATSGDVAWETDASIGTECVPYQNYCGNILFSTQWMYQGKMGMGARDRLGFHRCFERFNDLGRIVHARPQRRKSVLHVRSNQYKTSNAPAKLAPSHKCSRHCHRG
jgi:hypothetical protein